MSMFKCPHCMKEVQLEDGMAGQTVTCPHCSQQFVTPALNDIPMAQGNGLSAQPPQPESMATTSMILGIISFIGVPFCGLAALITGIISTSKINRSNGLLLGKGKAIAGIVFGCWSIIRIPILIIIAAMLLPAIQRSRESAKELICISNLKCISFAITLYASSHKDSLPTSIEDIRGFIESDPVMKLMSDHSTLKCPISHEEYTLLPIEAKKFTEIKELSKTTVFICTKHKKIDIVAFADGHVETRPKKNTSQP